MQANGKAFALYFENIFKIAPAKSDFEPLAALLGKLAAQAHYE